jgi:hypothetical protein
MAYRRGNYYYRSSRDGNRVRTHYLGKGELGRMLAAMDNEQIAERKHIQGEWTQEKEKQKTTERYIDGQAARIRNLAKIVLLAAGYHTHKGQWRRLRVLRELRDSG